VIVDAYVYGVAAGVAGGGSPVSADGVDGQSVELVERGGLAALVSDAPKVPVRANRRNLTAHAQVLGEVVAERCVLPMQFGVVMPDRGAVADELLGAHAERLVAHLQAFEPYVELDVRVLCPEDALLRSVVAKRPDIAELRASLEGRPPDATYYERIRLGELVAQAVAARRQGIEERTVELLEPLAAAAEAGETLHEQMLANVAFLVRRADVERFDRTVDQLGAELGDEVRISYVGPLAPHRFVDLAAESEVRAWA
jgi:hypothetical protein